MAQLFISHSSADNELALVVRERLTGLGYESIFLDVSGPDGLVPGAAWRDQLFTNLDNCQALVLVVTPSSNASKWCHSEVALARWLRKPVLALLVDGAPPHELVAELQGVKISSANVSADLLRDGLLALGLEQESAWDPSRSPFPGLQPLDESYAPVFFGRERQIEELRQLVDPPSRLRQGLVVPVLGPSGSGKSSLVRAGLVAALRRAPDWVVTDPFTPSDVPLAELALALSHAAKRFEVSLDTEECNALLAEPGGVTEYVRRLRTAGDLPDTTRVLVVVDQAEELVTVTKEAERTALFAALARAVEQPSPLRVVMTARTDLWDEVATSASRAGLAMAPTVLHVPPLSRADLSRVITEPARRANLTLEDGLLDRLLDDTGTGDALPLLAFTLSRMTALASDGMLTIAGYDALGGVHGAIATRAAAVAKGARTEQEVAAAVLQLVGAGEGQPAARIARVESVPTPQRAILDDLVEARLVVVREQGEFPVYAPAHEALFSAWAPLADMLTHRADDLRQRTRLERRAADWRDGGSSGSALLAGAELESAEEWQERSADLIGPEVAEYVAASQARQRRTRLVRIGVATAIVGLAITLVAVLVLNAADNRRQALEARLAELRAVAELERAPGGDPVAAAVAVLEGLELDPDSDGMNEAAEDLLASPARDKILVPSGVPATGLVVGARLAVVSTSSGPLPVDLRTGSPAGDVLAPGRPLAARPDDGVVVTVDDSKGLSWWDPTDASSGPLASSARWASQASYSPDGALMVSVAGNVVTLWNVAAPASPGEIASWVADPTSVTAVAVADDGRVYTSGLGATLLAWTPLASDASTTLVAEPPTNAAESATDLWLDIERGRVLVSRATAGTAGVIVYDLDTGDQEGTYVPAAGGPEDPLAEISASFASAMDPVSGAVAVFDIAGRGYVFAPGAATRSIAFLEGHTASVNLPSFTSDGLLASGSLDGSVRVWDVDKSASSTSGSTTESLCEAFGARLDEKSIERALGREPFDNPCATDEERRKQPSLDLTTAAPSGVVDESAVIADDFADGLSLFADDTIPLGGGGTLERRARSGSLRQSVRGAGEGFIVWAGGVKVSRFLTSADVAVTVSSPSRSTCGLTVSDGVNRTNVMLQPVSGAGRVVDFVNDETFVRDGSFAAGPATAGATDRTLSLTLRSGELVVAVDGAEVDRRKVDVTGALEVGPASEGARTDCVYDDFSVTAP